MNTQQEAVALFKFLESRGFKPSVRSIARALRDQKVVFDDKALRLWLKPFYRGATAPLPQKSSTITAGAPQPHRGFTRAVIVPLVSTPSSLRSDALPGFDSPPFSANGHANGKPKRKPPDDSWCEPLRAAARLLASRTIASLTPDERLTVGRTFALIVGGCTKTEATNRSRGGKVAKGLAGMAISDWGALTVAEYLGASRKAKTMLGDAPQLDPWIFKIVLPAPDKQVAL